MTKKDERINARLSEELARKLGYLAERTEQSASDVLRESIAVYYAQLEQTEAPAKDALRDFVGCAEGDEDLASRYKEELMRSLSEKA